MRRVTDWRARLSEAHEARRRTEFAYGEHDCGLFAADCVLAMTGVDLAASFRGRYRDAAGAQRLLETAGYADLNDAVAAYLKEYRDKEGNPNVAPARNGDVMAFKVETAMGWSLGIVIGERVTVLRPDGLGTMDRAEAAHAYRVP